MEHNSSKGRTLELQARDFFASLGITLHRHMAVPIGVSATKKTHKFDLGSDNPPVLVECKSHAWTETGNVPSAKISVWNEAMLHFLAAPHQYRKILFVSKSMRGGQSLAQYYVKHYSHLIPEGVELWEYSETSGSAIKVPLHSNA